MVTYSNWDSLVFFVTIFGGLALTIIVGIWIIALLVYVVSGERLWLDKNDWEATMNQYLNRFDGCFTALVRIAVILISLAFVLTFFLGTFFLIYSGFIS